jgi:hypothetical protein
MPPKTVRGIDSCESPLLKDVMMIGTKAAMVVKAVALTGRIRFTDEASTGPKDSLLYEETRRIAPLTMVPCKMRSPINE